MYFLFPFCKRKRTRRVILVSCTPTPTGTPVSLRKFTFSKKHEKAWKRKLLKERSGGTLLVLPQEMLGSGQRGRGTHRPQARVEVQHCRSEWDVWQHKPGPLSLERRNGPRRASGAIGVIYLGSAGCLSVRGWWRCPVLPVTRRPRERSWEGCEQERWEPGVVC